MNGVLLVRKEKEYTSFDVVAVLRGILHMKKIGHGGTLDPNATGVLPVFIGNASKLCDIMPYGDKEYIGEVLFGVGTDTEDIWGQVTEEVPFTHTEEEVKEAMLSFIGDYDQIPPMYSAKKINGKKMVDLARRGEEIERTAASLRIDELEILSMELPRAVFRASVSKGTYIRSLCRDMGKMLGVPACMSALTRTRHGNFLLSDAHTLSEIQEKSDCGEIEEWILPVDAVFPDYPRLAVKEEAGRFLLNGNSLTPDEFSENTEEITDGRKVLVYLNGEFKAIYEKNTAENLFRPYKMFIN